MKKKKNNDDGDKPKKKRKPNLKPAKGELMAMFSSPEEFEAQLLAVSKLHKDLLEAMGAATKSQVRFIVDMYYNMQRIRVKLGEQIRSQDKQDEPFGLLEWFHAQFCILENQTKNALEKYALSYQSGRWAMQFLGIGPVITAGLLAHITIDRENPDPKKRMDHQGKLQAYAGLDPTAVWEKGKKRPWNAKLKTLLYLAGESLIKQSSKDSKNFDPAYAHRFPGYKAREIELNDSGKHVESAHHDATAQFYRGGKMQTGRYGKTTEAWPWVNACYPAGMCQRLQDVSKQVPEEFLDTPKRKAGWIKDERDRLLKEERLTPGKGQPMLPPSQVNGRARRRLIKHFLNHFWEEMYVELYNEVPPRPWIFARGGHVDEFKRPNPTHPKPND